MENNPYSHLKFDPCSLQLFNQCMPSIHSANSEAINYAASASVTTTKTTTNNNIVTTMTSGHHLDQFHHLNAIVSKHQVSSNASAAASTAVAYDRHAKHLLQSVSSHNLYSNYHHHHNHHHHHHQSALTDIGAYYTSLAEQLSQQSLALESSAAQTLYTSPSSPRNHHNIDHLLQQHFHSSPSKITALPSTVTHLALPPLPAINSSSNSDLTTTTKPIFKETQSSSLLSPSASSSIFYKQHQSNQQHHGSLDYYQANKINCAGSNNYSRPNYSLQQSTCTDNHHHHYKSNNFNGHADEHSQNFCCKIHTNASTQNHGRSSANNLTADPQSLSKVPLLPYTNKNQMNRSSLKSTSTEQKSKQTNPFKRPRSRENHPQKLMANSCHHDNHIQHVCDGRQSKSSASMATNIPQAIPNNIYDHSGKSTIPLTGQSFNKRFDPLQLRPRVSTETLLEGHTVSGYLVNNEPRICMIQLFLDVLIDFPYDHINQMISKLRIISLPCTTKQVEVLKHKKALPIWVLNSELISRSDAERLCLEMYNSVAPEKKIETQFIVEESDNASPSSKAETLTNISLSTIPVNLCKRQPDIEGTIEGNTDTKIEDTSSHIIDKLENKFNQCSKDISDTQLNGNKSDVVEMVGSEAKANGAQSPIQEESSQQVNDESYEKENTIGMSSNFIDSNDAKGINSDDSCAQIEPLNYTSKTKTINDRAAKKDINERPVRTISKKAMVLERARNDLLMELHDKTENRQNKVEEKVMFDIDRHEEILSLAKGTKSMLSIRVYHRCIGMCSGLYYPALYLQPSSQCIECIVCHRLFSPRRFLGHTHGNKETRVCHWGFDSFKWRRYILLAKKQQTNKLEEEELMKVYNDLQNKFSEVKEIYYTAKITQELDKDSDYRARRLARENLLREMNNQCPVLPPDSISETSQKSDHVLTDESQKDTLKSCPTNDDGSKRLKLSSNVQSTVSLDYHVKNDSKNQEEAILSPTIMQLNAETYRDMSLLSGLETILTKRGAKADLKIEIMSEALRIMSKVRMDTMRQPACKSTFHNNNNNNSDNVRYLY